MVLLGMDIIVSDYFFLIKCLKFVLIFLLITFFYIDKSFFKFLVSAKTKSVSYVSILLEFRVSLFSRK